MTTNASDSVVVSEIMAQAREAEDLWRERNIAWADSRAMLTQSYKQKVPGFRQVLSNEPGSLHDLAVATLSGVDPTWNLPITTEAPDEQARMNKVERLCQGFTMEIDKRWRAKMHNGWLWDLCWYATMGAVVVFPYIVARGRMEMEFHCDIWDPYNVYPLPGEDGPSAVFRIYETTPSEARGILESNDGLDGWNPDAWGANRSYASEKPTVKVVNKWWEERTDKGKIKVMNAVLFDDTLVKKPTHHDEFRRMPVKIRPANGTPYRQYGDEKTPHYAATWGQSIIDRNKQMYKDLDNLLSFKMQIAADHALPTYLDINNEGQISVNWKRDGGKARVIPREIGEDFKPVQPPTMPKENDQMLDYFIGAVQRGGLSHVAFGSLGLEISGVTLQQLLVATRAKLRPYVDAVENVLEEIAGEFLDQFRRSRRKVELMTKSRQQGAVGSMMLEAFDASEVPSHLPIKATLPMALPDDLMERVTIARQLIPDNRPLADEVTVLEDILKFQDKGMIQNRMKDDMARLSPVKQATDVAIGLMREAMNIQAMFPDSESAQMEAQMKMQAAMQAMGQIQTALGSQQGGSNAQGSQRRQPEPRPEVRPAEAGPNNPDRFNQIFRAGNNGESRPSNTGDRLRNMGRGG